MSDFYKALEIVATTNYVNRRQILVEKIPTPTYKQESSIGIVYVYLDRSGDLIKKWSMYYGWQDYSIRPNWNVTGDTFFNMAYWNDIEIGVYSEDIKIVKEEKKQLKNFFEKKQKIKFNQQNKQNYNKSYSNKRMNFNQRYR